jgi:hypothetical protein
MYTIDLYEIPEGIYRYFVNKCEGVSKATTIPGISTLL